MNNQQYQIPDSLGEVHSLEIDQMVDGFALLPKSPEVQGQYETYKQIERNIEALRGVATEDMLPNPGFAGSILNQLMTPRPLIERLIDVESKIGGNLLPQEQNIIRQRFFFYQGYWYLEFTDQQGSMVASYQLDQSTAYKFHNGKNVPFDEDSGELDNLLKIIPLYEDAIRRQLYKSDFGLAA